MKKIYFLLLLSSATFAQVTLKITGWPANTPVGATIYLAGSVNTWNPADPAYAMQPDGLGNLQIVIPQGTGTVEYKFTRGSWPSVEGNATGSYLPNRSFTFSSAPQTINLTIQSWEDLGTGASGTAASNVQILSNAFGIPQLSTTRRIWLYLPPDYDTSAKNYPVLYMQDGQNLFDNLTSFSGEWQVDETLNNLFNQGDYGAIVVGIDNGGGERLNEYSPWVNPSYGGGDGEEYAAFLVNTLKPYIDANYRTRPEPAMSALIGSSMGALIATYTACEYPNVFRKVGNLSPAYWFALNDMNAYINTFAPSVLQNHRMYFVCGTTESSTMVPNVNTVKNNLMGKGLTAANTFTKFDSYGTHSENYWKGEFGATYTWLFQNETLSTSDATFTKPAITQTFSGKIYVEGLPSASDFEIYNLLGNKIQSMTLSTGIYELPDLAQGIYILKSTSNRLAPVKLIRN
ncbi:alpha/beta hydrolase [Flavobacterium sp. CYK-4]|uniref:alpha/beta hydrolase-fold protein n=1 Tax=Flavobacterium lotistagni TaxID=2709660 RepID=UPI00140DFFE9|nr:alpha/beta hydrolase-fold protein [Flavobacterium lotistagni]NHM05675.1 alpha/beta hydrolase [Flavobacterium lotistagni]